MAKITPSTNEKLISMKVFGGLHESPDGDNKLKTGEAVKCTNFKITNNGNLMKRFGTTLKWTLGDAPIKGMWHGWCSHHELFIAACDGHIFMLKDNKLKTYPVDLGPYNTDNDVHMFGFDEKVFVMNGVVYGQIYFDGIPIAETASATVTGTITAATVVASTFGTKVDDSGTYKFYYTANGWASGFSEMVDLVEYGITVTGTPDVGDKIDVVYNEALEGQWHFENLSDGNHGYRPLVATGIPAGGGGTLLEEVNKLNGMRRVWITGDGTGTSFKLPEKAHTVSKIIDNRNPSTTITGFSFTADTDTVTFSSPPPAIINVYEIQYEVSVNFASTVGAMRYSELYAGTQDSRVFIYGDGSNRAFYSSIDYLGHPRGDYFPDLYEVTVGDTNTPITGMIRHYTKMLAFKPLETFSIDYGVVTLADGLMTPSFYTTPVNKNAGNQAVGQVQLVLNAPRTLCQGNLYEWRNGSAYSANLSVDERQAKRISDRIYDTLQKMDFSKVHCYDDNLNTEYYIIDDGGNALVHNYFVDAWYYYSGIDARMATAIDGKLYIGTKSGKIMLLDETKTSDDGKPIECYWESGSMDFGAPNMRKYSSTLWVAVNEDQRNAVSVTVKTDRSEDNTEVDLEPEVEFDMPKVSKLKIKVKKFVFYKLIFKSNSANSRATVIDTEIKVRVTSQAK